VEERNRSCFYDPPAICGSPAIRFESYFIRLFRVARSILREPVATRLTDKKTMRKIGGRAGGRARGTAKIIGDEMGVRVSLKRLEETVKSLVARWQLG
jgi:hypothetical protein